MGVLIIDKSSAIDFSQKSIAKYYPQMDAIIKNNSGFTKYGLYTNSSIITSDLEKRTISAQDCLIKYTGLIGNLDHNPVLPTIFNINDYKDTVPISLCCYKDKSSNILSFRILVGRNYKYYVTDFNIGTTNITFNNDTVSGGKFCYMEIKTSYNGVQLSILSCKVNNQECTLTLSSQGSYESAGIPSRDIEFCGITGEWAYFIHSIMICTSIKADGEQVVLYDVEGGEDDNLRYMDKVSGNVLTWLNNNPELYKTTFEYPTIV